EDTPCGSRCAGERRKEESRGAICYPRLASSQNGSRALDAEVGLRTELVLLLPRALHEEELAQVRQRVEALIEVAEVRSPTAERHAEAEAATAAAEHLLLLIEVVQIALVGLIRADVVIGVDAVRVLHRGRDAGAGHAVLIRDLSEVLGLAIVHLAP